MPSDQNAELLPCELCRSAAAITDVRMSGYSFRPHCTRKGCLLYEQGVYFSTAIVATNVWNTRAPASPATVPATVPAGLPMVVPCPDGNENCEELHFSTDVDRLIAHVIRPAAQEDSVPAAKCKHLRYESHGDGMCRDGCCDKYRCLDCGKIFLEEGAD